MLAGAWALVLVPLVDALRAFGWASSVPLPNVFGFPGAVRTLDESFLGTMGVYAPVVFCIGVVLLFSKERGRRAGKLDWTRRWGVACSYIVLLLSAAPVLFISALVLAGIAALLQSMPLKYQPPVTRLFVEVSTGYLRYGPQPSDSSGDALVVFSSIAILLACVPLYDALRSTGGGGSGGSGAGAGPGAGPKRLAAVLVAPLALFALMYVAQVGQYLLGIGGVTSAELFRHRIYFCPELLAAHLAGPRAAGTAAAAGWSASGSVGAFVAEAIKWCIVLAIAVWLTIARLVTWWQGRRRLPKGGHRGA